MDRVELVITLLKMGWIGNVVVGASTGGGISGGQKRKVALGALQSAKQNPQRHCVSCRDVLRTLRTSAYIPAAYLQCHVIQLLSHWVLLHRCGDASAACAAAS